MTYPQTYRYSKEHEWIDVKGDLGTIGITDYAQGKLGDIVFVELPRVGTTLETAKSLGTIESVKTASEIYAPVSGEVIEVNGALKDAPETVNSDPHGAGWLVKVRMKNPGETDALMDGKSYEAFVSTSDNEDSH